MMKTFLGALCPVCRYWPYHGHISDLPFEKDDTAEIGCINCGARLLVRRQYVPQFTILALDTEEAK